MKVVDCTWEIKNLGRKTVETTVDKVDAFDPSFFSKLQEDNQYVVVKVPMCLVGFNFGLTKLGFTMIETQINISKKFKNFNFDDRLVKSIYPHVDTKDIETDSELSDIIECITPGMFTTDRIFLDSHFSPSLSATRYSNWVRSEYESGRGHIFKMFYDDKFVGFGMERRSENGELHGLLGGIFEAQQNSGLGLMTACVDFIVAHKRNQPFNVLRTSISSNNTPMLQFYNYLNYTIDSMMYVFVYSKNN